MTKKLGQSDGQDGYDVEIRRTSFGIPHIKAEDYGSLAFGVAYAYAEDNLQMIADAILTVRGDRSQYLSTETTVSIGGTKISNLDSDFFFKFYLNGGDLAVEYARERPRTVEMAEGYAAGLNYYLTEIGLRLLNPAYRDALSGSPISSKDFYLLLAQKAIQASGEAFVKAIIAARPPSDAAVQDATPVRHLSAPIIANFKPIQPNLGSNAFAFGYDLTETGKGILAANPHFPWQGHKRFYEMHLTIPNELDVMGAALPPFPVINIGFNKDIAWTHTVSESRTFAVYELKLTPDSPLRYVVDDKTEELRPIEILVSVKGKDGTLSSVKRTFYMSRFGPIIVMPEVGCHWTKDRAFAFQDLARPKISFVEQWMQINQAQNVRELKQSLATERGVPWLNTIAADKSGDVLYANFATAPCVTTTKRWRCAPSWRAIIASYKLNLAILNGSKSKCALETDSKRTSGIFPEEAMPFLIRRDYVLNCNDSHWLANLSQPLKGFSPFIGAERVTQGFRTRMGYKQLWELMEREDRRISVEEVKALISSTRNLAAELIIDALVMNCRVPGEVDLPDGRVIDIEPACEILINWTRCDDLESKGAVLFREFWQKAQNIDRLWNKQFNVKAPVTTPCELNIANPKVCKKLRVILAETVAQFAMLQLPLNVTLAEVQRYPTQNGAIGIPGGSGDAGVLNQVLFEPLTERGYGADDISGSSYTQVVSWNGDTPVADAILPFSQSSDISSPHYADQMKLFACKKWVRLPFTEEDILADPNLRSLRLSWNRRVVQNS